MSEPVDSIIVKYQAPEGYKLVHDTDYQDFLTWKNRISIEEWTLKEFSWHIWHQRGVTRAKNFLYSHRSDLDIANGGFIDYEHTHNGWRIPSEQIQGYISQLRTKEM
jgi:phage pi2 protein 07